MKSFATPHNDPVAPLCWRERIGYGTGSLGLFIIFPILSSFATMYMTDVAKLDIKIVAFIFGISRLLDGVTDIFAGILIDKTKHPMGKARTWILKATPGIFISFILLFYIPPAFPEYLKYVYLFIIYNLTTAVFFTISLVSESSLLSLMTRNPKEQTFLGNIQSIFNNIGIFFFSIFFMRLLTYFNGGNSQIFSQRAVFLTVVIFAAVGCSITLVSLLFVKERVSSDDVNDQKDSHKKEVVFKNFKKLLKNKNWIIVVISAALLNVSVQLNVTSLIYFSTYVLGDVEKFSLINGAFSLAQLAGAFVSFFVMQRLKSRKIIYIFLNIVLVISTLAIYINYSNLKFAVLCMVIRGFTVGMVYVINILMVADIIRYTAYKDKVNVSGICNASSSFANKAGIGLSTFVFGICMSAAGYNSSTEQILNGQSESVKSAIVFVFALLPAILSMIISVLMSFYDQDKKLIKYEGGGSYGTK